MKKCFVMVLLCCLLAAGTAFAKTGTLLVAFGTSMDSARPAIDDIEKAYKKAAGKEPVLLAFTSDIIRNKLAKEGTVIKYVAEKGCQAAYQYVEPGRGCEQHLHLKCVKCGKIIHLECHFMEEISHHIEESHGFTLQCKNSILYGVCKECKNRPEEK